MMGEGERGKERGRMMGEGGKREKEMGKERYRMVGGEGGGEGGQRMREREGEIGRREI